MKIANKRSLIGMTAGIVVLATAAFSFTTTVADHPAVAGDLDAPEAVKQIFQHACYDCHSNTGQVQWFDKLPGIATVVSRDIREARKHLNFSEWDRLSKAEQEGALWEAYNMINSGAMPLPAYKTLHRNATVTAAELATLRNYLNTKRKTVPVAAGTTVTDTLHTPATLPVAATGIRFMPEFRTWQVMSTTSRFDNTTMRVMFANPVAMQAIRNKQINPWPDGAIIAKVVWEKERGSDGTIHSGKFLNVQYMVRDQDRYKHTDGWGYAKFETPALKPYGTVLTAQTCASCHKAAANTGGIFDLSTFN